MFLRDAHEGYLSLENADNTQSNFAIGLKYFEKGKKTLEKKSILNNLGLLFSARKIIFNSVKSRLFLIKNLDKIPTRQPTPEPAAEPEVAKEPATESEVATEQTKATKAKTEHRICSWKLCRKLLNEIKNEGKL